MKLRNLIISLLLLALLSSLAIMTHYGATAADNKKPVNLTFPGIDGKAIKLADYRGKVVVLDIWATWCGYCVREIPELVSLQKEATVKKLPLQLIGVSVDRDNNDVKSFLKTQNIPYPIAMGDDKSLKTFGSIPGIPVKIIINKQGMIVDKIIGATDKDTLMKRVDKYLKAK